MIAPGLQYIAVFDVGKAKSKLGIVDTATIAECAECKTPRPRFGMESRRQESGRWLE